MASKKEIEGAAFRLRGGQSTYQEFAQETRERWVTMARWLMRRWRVPGWVDVEDVVQELMLGAWRGTWEYEAGRGTRTLGQHVEYTAVDKAKKRMHKWRGAPLHGNPDGEPSSIDVPFCLVDGSGQDWVDRLASLPASQEESLMRGEHDLAVLRRCMSIEELLVMQALLETESFQGSAELIFGDPEARRLLELRTEEQAARLVVRTAYAVDRRILQERAA
jgi:DNA-directed RNA polymerase specialized sigma24 family protein